MQESLAQTLRGGLYDNPLVLLDRRHAEPVHHFLSDPELEEAAHLVVRRVAPACPECGVKMLFVQANDFEGWSCAKTPGCTFHLTLP